MYCFPAALNQSVETASIGLEVLDSIGGSAGVLGEYFLAFHAWADQFPEFQNSWLRFHWSPVWIRELVIGHQQSCVPFHVHKRIEMCMRIPSKPADVFEIPPCCPNSLSRRFVWEIYDLSIHWSWILPGVSNISEWPRWSRGIQIGGTIRRRFSVEMGQPRRHIRPTMPRNIVPPNEILT